MTEEETLEYVKHKAAAMWNVIRDIPKPLMGQVNHHFNLISKQAIAEALIINDPNLTKVIPEPEPAVETPAEPQAEDQTESP